MWDAVTFVDWIWCCGTVLWPFLHAELRCDKVMDTFSGCGLCLPNLTQLPLHHLRDHRPPICVEIKVNSTFSLIQPQHVTTIMTELLFISRKKLHFKKWQCCNFIHILKIITYRDCMQVCQKLRLECVDFSVACLITSGHWTCWQLLMGFSISSHSVLLNWKLWMSYKTRTSFFLGISLLKMSIFGEVNHSSWMTHWIYLCGI